MPIQKLLATGDFTPEQRHVFELAFNSSLGKLGLVDRDDPICEMVAKKIIEIGLSAPLTAVAIKESGGPMSVPTRNKNPRRICATR
jgi:hypothetical protein